VTDQQPVPFMPTPRDLMRDAVDAAKAVTRPVDIPVLDLPMREDTPRTQEQDPPQLFSVTIYADGFNIDVERVVRWREDIDTRRLDVYGTCGKLCTVAGGHWVSIQRVTDTTGADA
jgi:hypothetical protein